jgi:hypothetical protein
MSAALGGTENYFSGAVAGVKRGKSMAGGKSCTAGPNPFNQLF